MSRLPITIATWDYDRVRPLVDGRVRVEGCDVNYITMPVEECFERAYFHGAFEVAEIGFSPYLIALSRGTPPYVAVPAFLSRMFRHSAVYIRSDRGIAGPADLKGKRVGVPEYQQTAALWTRGALEHEFGVHARDMEWWMERVPSHSHRGAVGFEPPPGVVIRQVPAEKNLGGMIVAGEIDAIVHYIANPNLVDRSRLDLAREPAVRPLFPDPLAEGVRYYQKTGLLPINHGMVLKRSVYDRHPWVVLNLLKAFDRANEIAEQERLAHAQYHIATGLADAERLRTPLVRHGVKANRRVLETAAQYSQEQGLTTRRVKLEELFAPSALEQ